MAQKLLLMEDVEDLGRSGDVVKVKPGYARNFLLPKGLARVADKNTIRLQERLQVERQKKAVEDRKDAEKLAERLKDVTVEALVKVDQEGHMYGSVSVLDIVQLLQGKHEIVVDKRSVQLEHPIKKIGVQKVELKLKEGVGAAILVKVISDEGTPPPTTEV